MSIYTKLRSLGASCTKFTGHLPHGAEAPSRSIYRSISKRVLSLSFLALIAPSVYAQGLALTVDVPAGTTSVKMHSDAFDWSLEAAAIASDNSDGTWTVTLNPAPASNIEYVWVVDDVIEVLYDNAGLGECTAEIDAGTFHTDYFSWGNRKHAVDSGDVTSDVYEACAGTVIDGGTDGSTDGSTDGGNTATPLAIQGDWKLAPVAGALGVGPNQGDTGWWSSNTDDVTTRACLFDDVYSLKADGVFANEMGADTWLETWQGVAAEACGAPVAPHDGSNAAATYASDADANTLTVSGAGAFVGLAKVTNAGQISDGAAVADSITYQVSALTDTSMTLDANMGAGGWWRFKLVSADYVAPSDVSVTFQVDMSAVETVSTDGVYLAGGNFGQDGELLTDVGNGIWSVTLDLAPDTQYLYKFRNQAANGGWDGFEDAAGLVAGECNSGQYNDRSVDVAGASVVLSAVAYGSCTAEPYVAPSGPTLPTAPVPTDAAETVLSVFGTTYGTLEGTNFNPGWGQATAVSVDANLVYTGLNFQGTQFDGSLDVSGYEYLNVDFYVTESTALNFVLISDGAETPVALDVAQTGQWVNVQIPLSSYSDVVNLAAVIQFKVDGNGSVAFNNLYFGGTAPVVSTDVSVTFQVDMSEVETVSADGVYIAGGGFGQDGHLLTEGADNVWSVTLELAAGQHTYKFRNQAANGGWDGFEDAAGLVAGECNTGEYNDRFVDVSDADVVLGVVAYGSCTADAYVPPAGPEVPTAPVPSDASESVLSVFGTTYGNLDGTDFNPGWGQATAVSVGTNLVYSGLNYQGTQFASS